MKTSKEFRTATRQICETRIRDGLGFDWRFGAREMANALDDLDELEEKCDELQGLYGAEYDHTKTLLARCARQEELLERADSFARHVSACTDHSDTPFSDLAEDWLADLEEFRKK